MVVGGDILLSVDGILADSAANLMKIRDQLAARKSGAPIRSTILRAGKIIELTGTVP